MEGIEPGIYRIVNVGEGTAITVPADNAHRIVGWSTPNQPGQQWIVRYFAGKYHISDRVHGRYIVVDSAKHLTKAFLGCSPTLWEIIPIRESAWIIKLPEYELGLNMAFNNNGSNIHLWGDIVGSLDSRWRFERLGDLPDEPRPDRPGMANTDYIIAQMAEQLAQQSKQLVELAGQLAEQNRRIADQTQRIADQNQANAHQGEEILALKRQVEEKDRQLAHANSEVRYMLARIAQTAQPPNQNRVVGDTGSGNGEPLRDKVEHLEGLVNQLIDKGNKMPNNMS